jgi:hypothetical protein
MPALRQVQGVHYHFPLIAVWTSSAYPFHLHQHQRYGRAGCIPFHCQQYGRAGCIPFHCQQYGRAACIPFHCQQYGQEGCIPFHHQQSERAGSIPVYRLQCGRAGVCIPFYLCKVFLKCWNVGLSGIGLVRYRNEQKCRRRNHSSTGIRGPSPVLECSYTGLR